MLNLVQVVRGEAASLASRAAFALSKGPAAVSFSCSAEQFEPVLILPDGNAAVPRKLGEQSFSGTRSYELPAGSVAVSSNLRIGVGFIGHYPLDVMRLDAYEPTHEAIEAAKAVAVEFSDRFGISSFQAQLHYRTVGRSVIEVMLPQKIFTSVNAAFDYFGQGSNYQKPSIGHSR